MITILPQDGGRYNENGPHLKTDEWQAQGQVTWERLLPVYALNQTKGNNDDDDDDDDNSKTPYATNCEDTNCVTNCEDTNLWQTWP